VRLDHLLSRERESVPFGVVPALTPSQVDRPIFAECPLGGSRVSASVEAIVTTQQTNTDISLANPSRFPATLQLLMVQPDTVPH
jgi:hypothetical protein